MSNISRYRRVPIIGGGRKLGTSRVCLAINRSVRFGRINSFKYIVKEGERLDTLAGRFLGNGNLWWVIAAASGIGWGLQVPPGTELKIPSDMSQINAMVG